MKCGDSVFVALVVAYEGTDFHGYQIQRPELRTIQGELQEALYHMFGQPVPTQASGRTDAGVHARGQIVTCNLPVEIPLPKLPIAINTRLPSEIRVLKAVQVSSDFHPRFDAKSKTYRYEVDRSITGDLFRRKTAYHYPYPIEVERMREAAKELEGSHDFTSFCAAATPLEDRVRTLFRVQVEDLPEEQTLVFWVEGSGFLWNMVRIIVGTLLDVGRGRIQAADIPKILESRDRKLAGHTAPAHGLFLWKVEYPDANLNKELYTRLG